MFCIMSEFVTSPGPAPKGNSEMVHIIHEIWPDEKLPDRITLETLMEALATSKREANAGAFFVHSKDYPDFDASFSPLISMYPMPTIASYGGHFPMADIQLAVRCSQAEVPLAHLPPDVAGMLTSLGVHSYDFFWNIVDIQDLLAKNINKLNLIHHPWVYEHELSTAAFNPKIRMASLFPMGAFTYEGSFIEPSKPVCLPFQCLDKLRVSVHSQQGGMCCSPNNARFMVIDSPRSRISYMWTVLVRADRDKPLRACVSLQWLLRRPSPIPAIIRSTTSLSEIFPLLSAILLGEPCSLAMSLAFGLGDPWSINVTKVFASPATRPLKCERKQPAPQQANNKLKGKDAQCDDEEEEDGDSAKAGEAPKALPSEAGSSQRDRGASAESGDTTKSSDASASQKSVPGQDATAMSKSARKNKNRRDKKRQEQSN